MRPETGKDISPLVCICKSPSNISTLPKCFFRCFFALERASLKKFIGDIDVEFPNLENEDINKIYFLTKEKHRPGQLKSSKPEIKPESEGGMSYWSMRTHRWVLPRLDKQTKKYIPPQKNH